MSCCIKRFETSRLPFNCSCFFHVVASRVQKTSFHRLTATTRYIMYRLQSEKGKAVGTGVSPCNWKFNLNRLRGIERNFLKNPIHFVPVFSYWSISKSADSTTSGIFWKIFLNMKEFVSQFTCAARRRYMVASFLHRANFPTEKDLQNMEHPLVAAMSTFSRYTCGGSSAYLHTEFILLHRLHSNVTLRCSFSSLFPLELYIDVKRFNRELCKY